MRLGYGHLKSKSAHRKVSFNIATQYGKSFRWCIHGRTVPSEPTIPSISLCAFRSVSGFKSMAIKNQMMVLAVVSVPPRNISPVARLADSTYEVPMKYSSHLPQLSHHQNPLSPLNKTRSMQARCALPWLFLLHQLDERRTVECD